MIINDAGFKLVGLNVITRKLVIRHVPVGVSHREGSVQGLSITQLMAGIQHNCSEITIVVTRGCTAYAGVTTVAQVFCGIGLGRQAPVMNPLIAGRSCVEISIPIITFLDTDFVVEGVLWVIRDDIDYSLLIEGYMVYNKTGDIGISYSDAGLIQMPDNRRAVAGFMVQGPFNDPRSAELIRAMAAAMAPALQQKSPNQ